MTGPTLRLGTRHRPGGQDGFALALALGMLLVFGIVVVAVLGLSLTGSATAGGAAAQLREQRVVDGALDAGINALKTSPDAVLGRPGSCGSLDGRTIAVDGTNATLACTGEVSTAPQVAGPGGVALTALGGFTGTLDDVVDNRLEPLVSGIAGGLGAWFKSQFDQGPGLAHYGQDALRIAGDVRVRNGAFGYRFTGTPDVPGPSPAFDVSGTYSQGQCGPIGCLDFSLFGIPILTSPACGMLVPNVVPGQEFGSGLSATGGLNCNLGTTNPLFADPAPAAPAAWPATALRSGPVLPAACPKAGNVVTISPGAYGVAATKVLNQWFSVGNCDDVTFWFPPGDYAFDAAGLWGGERNSLLLADPTAKYVFGAPNGWSAPGGAAAVNFPGACDATAQGVSITLTVRTAIKHRAGLLAACGRQDGSGQALPLVYQPVPGSASVTWAAKPTTATSDLHPTIKFANPTAALDSKGTVPATYPSYAPAYPTGEFTRTYATTSCATECSPTISLGGFSDPGTPAPYGAFVRDTVFPFAPKVFLKIRGTANISTQNFGFPKVVWVVYLGDGSTNPDGTPARCTGEMSSQLPSNPESNVLSIPIGQECASQAGLVDASQLEGARVDITYRFSLACTWFGCPPQASAGIDFAWLEATTDPSTALPAAMEVAVDPANGTAAYYFGPVYVPRSQTEVRWKGSANESPLFVGGLTTRALASGPPNAAATNYRTGIVAAGGLAPSQRIVTLNVVIDGRLRGSARVVITDDDTAHLRLDPGRLLEVTSWRYCDRPLGDSSCWAP